MGCAQSNVAGEEVFFCGSGQKLFRGQRGKVENVRRGQVIVSFEGRGSPVTLAPEDVSRELPELHDPIGTKVYYGGPRCTYTNGESLNFGQQGELCGSYGAVSGGDSDLLAVRFAHLAEVKTLRRAVVFVAPIRIPGSFELGEQVYWCGTDFTFADGEQLSFGAVGEIAGCTSVCDGHDHERVAVLFAHRAAPVAVRWAELCRAKPRLPNGLQVGDKVYYAFPTWTAPDGSELTFGAEGKVSGCSLLGDGRDDERLWVSFENVHGCISLGQLSLDRPFIPGGFRCEEQLFYCGPTRTSPEGETQRFGSRVAVAGGRNGHVAVVFPGHEDWSEVPLHELSRDKPVIPGSFEHGERIFYVGPSCRYEPGGCLIYGAVGQVVGRSCLGDGKDEQRLSAFFQSGGAAVAVALSEVARQVPEDLTRRLLAQLAKSAEDMPTSPASPRRAASRSKSLDFASERWTSEAEEQVPLERVPTLVTPRLLGTSGVVRMELEDLTTAAVTAAVFRVAKDAGLDEVAQEAEAMGHQQVARACEAEDLPLLSEICREAEEQCWEELQQAARAKLTQVALGKLQEKESAARCQQQLTQIQDVSIPDMQCLLNETYTGWGAHGRGTRTRDRAGAAPESLEVQRVVALRKEEVYLKYLIRQKVIESEMPCGAARWDIRTASTSSRSRLGTLRADLNECYLWHGTGPKEATSIARQGFDLRQAGTGRGSLFGRGLYFAESCLKADEYAKPNADMLFPLILCRVTLGNVNYCDAEDPLGEALRRSCRASTDFFHSVLGDREKLRQTFREFVVFEDHQVFPEYVVWYRRKWADGS